jgi:two-component sensor histidine kinase
MKNTPIDLEKHKFADALLKILVIVGFVALVPSLYLSIVEKVWIIAVIDTMCYFYIVFISLAKWVSMSVKILSLSALSYVLGVLLLVFTGPFGAGIVYLFAFIFISALFYTPRVTLGANLLVVFTFVGFGLLNQLDVLQWRQSLESVLVIMVNFVLVALILSFGISLLIKNLNNQISNQARLQKQLQDEVAQKQAQTLRAEQALATQIHLVKELHHRVKNNLQLISSLINLHLHRQSGAGDRLEGLKERVLAISRVHWLLYTDNQIASVDLRNMLDHILDNLIVTLRSDSISFKKNIDVPQMQIAADKATLISLVLNEILTNSAKHAFPDGRKGEIRIDISRDGRSLGLIVSDNGVGFGSGQWNDKNNFGMEILSVLFKQLKADFSLSSTDGVRYAIHIPLD